MYPMIIKENKTHIGKIKIDPVIYEEVYSFSKKLLKLKISSIERNCLNDIIKSLT